MMPKYHISITVFFRKQTPWEKEFLAAAENRSKQTENVVARVDLVSTISSEEH